jgi:hypothetical protein
MSRFKHESNNTDRGRPVSPDSHVTDEFLLLSIDDELSASDAEIVNAHVAVCWSCRTRKEEFEESVRGVVEYRNARTSPYLPPPEGGPAILRGRLNRQAEELSRASLLAKWASGFRRLLSAPSSSRPGWIATTVVIVLALLVFQLDRRQNIPVISAAELLLKAEQSEGKILSATSKPVVRQRVRIEVNGIAVIRTIYRDPSGKRHASRVEVNASHEPEAEKVFRTTAFDWDDPLSPARFDEWRQDLDDRRDDVLADGLSFLRLRTTTSLGRVAEASLTVRSSDYHPIAESLQLRDSGTIEIAELSYEVMGLDGLDSNIFGNPLGNPVPPVRLALNPPSVAPPGPTDTELTAAELQVRSELHRIGADLGEQIEIEETPTRHIAVNALAVDETRKSEIQSALARIPLAEVNVRTIAEASEAEQATASPGQLPGRITARSVDATPLLDKQLKERLKGTNERASFVNQSLGLAQGASARAWALRRLADRYTPNEISVMDRASKQKLEELLSDHVGALQQDISRLRNQFGIVMSISSNTAAANTSVAGTAPVTGKEAPTPTEDWRAQVRRIHSSVETVNECVAVLLGGSASEGEDAEKLEIRLRTALTELQTELETLDHQVRTQF